MGVDLMNIFCMISWSRKGYMMWGHHGHHSLSPEETKFTSALKLMQTLQFYLTQLEPLIDVNIFCEYP